MNRARTRKPEAGGQQPNGMSPYTGLRFIGLSAVLAAVLHIAEFHLGLSVDGSLQNKAAWALGMLVHCPVLPWVALGGAVGLFVFARGDPRFLLNLAFVRKAGRRHSSTPNQREPVNTVHVACFAIAFAGSQLLVFTLLMHLM